MKKSIKYYLMGLVMLFTTLVGLAINSDSAHAIETTLTVSPMEQKVTLYPGESSTGSIKVSNPASATEELYYTVSVVPFTRSGANYDPLVGNKLSDGSHNDAVNWVTLSSSSGNVKPNEQDEIIYTIDVPKDARGGGQYFAILVTRTDDPTKTEEEGNAKLKEIVQIASTVYATISGSDIQLTGSINDNEIPSFLLAPPIKASFTVENTGNTHMEINYYLQVFPLFSDEEVYTNEEDPGYAIVLPETTRYIKQEWNESPQIGIFKVRQVVSYSDNDDKSITEKTVIVCPIWLLFIILFIIAAIIIWIITRIRRHKKPSKRQDIKAANE